MRFGSLQRLSKRGNLMFGDFIRTRGDSETQLFDLRECQIANSTGTTGRAIHAGIVHEHQMAIFGSVHVRFEDVVAEPHSFVDVRQRILRCIELTRMPPTASMGDDHHVLGIRISELAQNAVYGLFRQ